jgi:two-component system response regulator YesN
MYSVLVVDDEEPVLDSFELMLKNSAHFVLTGKARSGYEALNVITNTKPDLVFMDINIPGKNGLEVIEEVNKKNPSTVFVLSTAYERFDLAQKAIPLGVFEYLVKPISKSTFTAALEKVRNYLDTRHPLPEQFPEEKQEKEHFLRKLIWKPMSREDWEKYREKFGFPSGKGLVCLFELGEAPDSAGFLIAEKLSLCYHCSCDILSSLGLYFFSGNFEKDVLEAALEKAARETLPAGGFQYGLGGLYSGQDLYLSCSEALEALRQKQNGGETGNRERLRLIQLRRRIGVAPPAESEALFEKLWQGVFESLEFAAAKAEMVSVFKFLIDDCTGCYSSNPDAVPLFSAAEEIMPLKDISAWKAWAGGAFEQILRHAASRRKAAFPIHLIRAMDYIQEHYTEPIQLHDAAESTQVSDAYLSRLFSEHLRVNFIDYLTDLRLEAAEKLLREPGRTVKEIAYAVGYQDPNYFSKIFKKNTGISPRDFGANT